MVQFTRNCGRCGNLVDFKPTEVIHHVSLTASQYDDVLKKGKLSVHNQVNNMNSISGLDEIEMAALASCNRCKGCSMFVFRTKRTNYSMIYDVISSTNRRVSFADHNVELLEVWPKAIEAQNDEEWPERVAKLFIDAQNMLAQNMTPSLILTTCRTVLEVALKELETEPSKETLYQRINKLHEVGEINETLQKWAHGLRIEGNDAVHEGEGSKDDAETFVEFLKMFLHYVFTLPVRINKRREATMPAKEELDKKN